MDAKTHPKRRQLYSDILDKSQMKQDVFDATKESLGVLKSVSGEIASQYMAYEESRKPQRSIPMEVEVHGDFEFSLKFGGDTLLFLMHTNVFEIPRDHKMMQSKYIKTDPTRSYCGIIHVYNFLTDSFKYNRVNDLGYLIGRIFVNHEKHYFIDGKSELGFMYNNFRNHVINEQSVEKIITSAIQYTLGFDLLIPSYDQVKLVAVSDMKSTLDMISIKTGKRLGFKFYPDHFLDE
ncbi:MAG: hypothetical protein IH595_10095 [Bacteroidales bacterium]|nr:hypothetical protein [Bacteroidales bacterium]